MTDQVVVENYALLGDRELLRRFAQDADDEAFAEIVRRYERLVITVCRRVIGSAPEVDDAFQATFITLAKRPRQIRKVQSLSSWLYSVAWRVSVRLVRARRKHPVQPLPEEQQSGSAPDPLQQIADDQDAVILDEELNSLPDRYRDVLVMTYFADQTSQQIADQLDVSKGTVDGRIRQGRNMLRVRLARRGVGIGALVAATNLLAAETASASPLLVEGTIQLGSQTLTQSMPGTTDLSHLEPLVRPEISSMIGTKTLLTTFVGIAALAGLAGMGTGTQDEGGGQTTAAAINTKAVAGSDGPSRVRAGSTKGETEPVVVLTTKSPAAVNALVPKSKGAAAFKSYPDNVRPGEKWLYETMEKSLKSVDFAEGETLAEVLDGLAAMCTAYHGEDQFEMQIWADQLALEESQIESFEDLTLKRDIELRNASVENVLKLILENLSGVDEPLTTIVKNEVLKVTTQAEVEATENYYIRAYPVASLLDVPINSATVSGGRIGGGMSAGGMGGGGGLFNVPVQTKGTARKQSTSGLGNASSGGAAGYGADGGGLSRAGGAGDGHDGHDGDDAGYGAGGMGGPDIRSASDRGNDLVKLVMEMTRPPALWQDSDGEGGTIAVVGDRLVVRQSDCVHREITKLLNLLVQNK